VPLDSHQCESLASAATCSFSPPPPRDRWQRWPKVHRPVPSIKSMSRVSNATWDQKTEGSLLCSGLFQEHRLGMENRGSGRLRSLEASRCKAGHRAQMLWWPWTPAMAMDSCFPSPASPGLWWAVLHRWLSAAPSLPWWGRWWVRFLCPQWPHSPLCTESAHWQHPPWGEMSRQKTTLRCLPAKAVGSSR